MSTDLGQKTAQQPTTRAELARQLLARLDRIATRLGEVSLAAEVQLLKRELVRGHALLCIRPEDNNYLSVITLTPNSIELRPFAHLDITSSPAFLSETGGLQVFPPCPLDRMTMSGGSPRRIRQSCAQARRD